jgi:hypothetical protein
MRAVGRGAADGGCGKWSAALRLASAEPGSPRYADHVQMKKAEQLRRDWAAKGSPPCAHDVLDKEYYLGADTGDLVCTTCGDTWGRQDPDRPGTTRFPKEH